MNHSTEGLSWRSPWWWGVPTLSLIGLVTVWSAGVNQPLFLWFNGLSRYTGEALWAHLTLFGDGVVGLVLVLPFVGRRPDIVRAMMVAALLAALWAVGLKALVGAPRPAAVLPPETINIIGPVLKKFAFPSGHTTTIFTLAGVLCLHISSNRLRLLLVLFAVAVGCSRMVVGAHWPADVLAGAFGGWLAAAAGTILARHWAMGLRTRAQRIFALLLGLLTAWLLLFHHTGDPDTLILQRLIAVGALLLALPGVRRLFWGR